RPAVPGGRDEVGDGHEEAVPRLEVAGGEEERGDHGGREAPQPERHDGLRPTTPVGSPALHGARFILLTASHGVRSGGVYHFSPRAPPPQAVHFMPCVRADGNGNVGASIPPTSRRWGWSEERRVGKARGEGG